MSETPTIPDFITRLEFISSQVFANNVLGDIIRAARGLQATFPEIEVSESLGYISISEMREVLERKVAKLFKLEDHPSIYSERDPLDGDGRFAFIHRDDSVTYFTVYSTHYKDVMHGQDPHDYVPVILIKVIIRHHSMRCDWEPSWVGLRAPEVRPLSMGIPVTRFRHVSFLAYCSETIGKPLHKKTVKLNRCLAKGEKYYAPTAAIVAVRLMASGSFSVIHEETDASVTAWSNDSSSVYRIEWSKTSTHRPFIDFPDEMTVTVERIGTKAQSKKVGQYFSELADWIVSESSHTAYEASRKKEAEQEKLQLDAEIAEIERETAHDREVQKLGKHLRDFYRYLTEQGIEERAALNYVKMTDAIFEGAYVDLKDRLKELVNPTLGTRLSLWWRKD